MLKRIDITGAALIAALTLTALIASASAQASTCYEVSEAKAGKEGQYNNAKCEGKPTEHLLEGKWVLVEKLIARTKENLWCAEIRLVLPENISGEDGYFTSSTCTTKLSEANKNKSDWTEVVVPESVTSPNVLPEGTGALPVTATSSSGTSTFGTGALEITSAKSKGTLTTNSAKLGSFTLEFEENKNILSGVKCTGLADAGKTGLILVAGTFHYRDYKEGTTLRTAAVFLLVPVHFECGGVTLVVVSGCVAGALTPESVLTKTLTVTLAKTGKDNTIVTVLNEANTANELCQLLASINGATASLSAQVTTQTLTGFKQNGAAVEVLVMPL